MRTMCDMTTGEKIERLMEAKGLSRARLAQLAGVSKSTVTNWCEGGSLKLNAAWKVARTLGVSLDFLADADLSEPPPPALSDDEAALLPLIRDLGVAEARRRLLLAGGRREVALREHPLDSPPFRNKGVG